MLVTGGAGFVGSHIVDLLIERGIEVRVLDSLHPNAHTGEPPYLNPKAEYSFGDLQDSMLVDTLVRDVDAVSHQAAMVGLGTSFDDVESYVRDNCLGTAVLLRALNRRGFRGRIVLASSVVVYGEGAYRCSRHGMVRPGPRDPALLDTGYFEARCPRCGLAAEPEPVSEDAPLDPRSVYAATKVHQEHLCFAFARAAGASVVALRYHNVYGPRMPRNTPYAGVAAIFRSALEAGRAPEVFEDGKQLRDFVHVQDVARANLLALCGEALPDAALNVASGVSHTIGAMAAALAQAFGAGARPPRVTGRHRPGDVRHVIASPARACEVLGFEATVSFEEGMAELAGAPPR